MWVNEALTVKLDRRWRGVNRALDLQVGEEDKAKGKFYGCYMMLIEL